MRIGRPMWPPTQVPQCRPCAMRGTIPRLSSAGAYPRRLVSMSSSGITVVELAAALERRFPAAWAEDWDRVGLIVGDVTARITGVLVTLDATAEAVRRAIESGANVLVTHHPPHLSAPEEVTACGGPAGTLEAALRLGVAVISLHTHLDRSPE